MHFQISVLPEPQIRSSQTSSGARRGEGQSASLRARARACCFRYAARRRRMKDRRPGSLIGVDTPGLRCAAPWQAFSQGFYAPATRALSSASGRHGCLAPLSLRPIGSTTAVAVACRCGSAVAAITATFTAPGSARRFVVASRCVALRHVINARVAERIVMQPGNVAGARASHTQ